MFNRLAALAMVAFLTLSAQACAQTFPVYQEPTVAYLDRDRLFIESIVGKALIEQNLLVSKELSVELRQIEKDLSAEEDNLVEQRKVDPPDVFKQKAQAFDVKVKKIRAEQELRARALGTSLENSRLDFYRKADPILLRLMRERGIILLLRKGSVLIALENADITDEAIERINAEMVQ